MEKFYLVTQGDFNAKNLFNNKILVSPLRVINYGIGKDNVLQYITGKFGLTDCHFDNFANGIDLVEISEIDLDFLFQDWSKTNNNKLPIKLNWEIESEEIFELEYSSVRFAIKRGKDSIEIKPLKSF